MSDLILDSCNPEHYCVTFLNCIYVLTNGINFMLQHRNWYLPILTNKHFHYVKKWQGFQRFSPLFCTLFRFSLAIHFNLQALFKTFCFQSSPIQFLLTIFSKLYVWYLKFFNVRFHLPCVKPVIQLSLIYLNSFWCMQSSLTTCSKFWIIRKFNKFLTGFSAKKFIHN